jgi:tetraacyldisaccharide 4'-kinase
MRRRRGDQHRVMRWLWTSRRFDARLARLALLPAAGLFRASMAARTLVYRRGWLPVRALPLPSVAVGNLTAGGSGKASISAWVARHYVARGVVPGVVVPALDGRAGVRAHAVPGAVVVADDDAARGAERVRAAGARVVVLEDAFQRLEVRRDYNVAVVSAETLHAVQWPLPAGPWREGWEALRRADALVITRKRAGAAAAHELAERLRPLVQGPVAVVSLGLREVEGLVSGRRLPAEVLRGKRVVAASSLADPDAFVAHVKSTGAAVQVAAAWKNPREFAPEDVAWLARATRKSDHVVVTEQDAVKLRDRWPNNTPEPFVAVLDLVWEAGGEAIVAGLDAVAGAAPQSPAQRF